MLQEGLFGRGLAQGPHGLLLHVSVSDWTLCWPTRGSECCQRFIRASELLFCPPSLLSLDFMLADALALIRVLLALHQGVRVSFFGPLLLLAFRNFAIVYAKNGTTAPRAIPHPPTPVSHPQNTP